MPVGFESLGVRSMCVFIETADVRVLIDAGVALGPRFGKLPHPREYQARDACRAKIRECAEKADVIVTSHYHNDHHTPNYTETVWLGSSSQEAEQIYRDKPVFLKDPRNFINFNQRRRGWMFQKFLKRIGAKPNVVDGKIIEFGATRLKFSNPMPHGEGGLGWVIMTTVAARGERVLHSSDVQGPMSQEALHAILSEKPDLLILGGPPLYLEGVKVEKSSIENALDNGSKVVESVPMVVYEHHALRLENWKERIREVSDIAQRAGHRILTGAEYAGLPPMLLESIRQRLYDEEPPDSDFIKWAKLPRSKRSLVPPPL